MYPKEVEIINWAYEKGIIGKSSDRLAQAFKTVEEIAELLNNYSKNRSIVDDIGDIYVTIVIQAHMNDLNLEACLIPTKHNLVSTREELVSLVSEAGNLCYLILKDVSPVQISVPMSKMYTSLIRICDNEELSLSLCVDHSYNEIKNRQGKMVNGVFVKNE